MGYAISWLAVRSETSQDLLTRLRLTETGEEDELFETPLSGGPLKGGWYLVVANDCEHRIVSEAVLSELSTKYDLVACSVEEHVMFSTAAHWHAGRASWTIRHDSSRGMFDLEVSGSPPPSLSKHQASCTAEQEQAGGADADVDHLFEVPLLVAKELTGFKHDEVTNCHARPLEILKDEVVKRRWKLW